MEQVQAFSFVPVFLNGYDLAAMDEAPKKAKALLKGRLTMLDIEKILCSVISGLSAKLVGTLLVI